MSQPSGKIRAAQVVEAGKAPQFVQLDKVPAPDRYQGPLVRVKVEAAALHHLVRGRASGRHYSAGGVQGMIPGVDGVGSLENGQKVFFTAASGPGSFAEEVMVPEGQVFPLPSPTKLSPGAWAASINPAFSSWMAFKTRVLPDAMKPGFSIAILGATSASGIIAAAFAKAFGAGKVIGVARSAEKLAQLPNLDERIEIKEEVEQTDFSQLDNVDIVFDYLYGSIAQHLLTALATKAHAKRADPPQSLCYINIGSITGGTLALPAAALRSFDLTVRGSGIGAWSLDELHRLMPALIKAINTNKHLAAASFEAFPIEQVSEGWDRKDLNGRAVFTF